VAADPRNRAAAVAPEIDFLLSRKPMASRLLDAVAQGRLPLRVTHNDTKLNNVMIDDATSEGICAIDLDTVMPGLVAYDFGDMIRTAASPAAEDERDLSKIVARPDMIRSMEDQEDGLNAFVRECMARGR
jgi:Ser/Thr protein kinase RdoA (MazF antagonist)